MHFHHLSLPTSPVVRHCCHVSDEFHMSPWHLVAFLGELVLWSCAAWVGWTLVIGPARLLAAAALLVGIVIIWSIWAAPRAKWRLSLRPRLGLITVLGLGVSTLFLSVTHWPGIIIALTSTAVIVAAQFMDERTEGET